MMRNKSALSLKLPSGINFVMNVSGGCCLARPTSGNEPEEHSPELIRWEWINKSCQRQALDFTKTRLCSMTLFDCRGLIDPLMSQNANLRNLESEVCKQVLMYLVVMSRSVRAASVLQEALCVAEPLVLRACNPEIKGRTVLFRRIT